MSTRYTIIIYLLYCLLNLTERLHKNFNQIKSNTGLCREKNSQKNIQFNNFTELNGSSILFAKHIKNLFILHVICIKY